MKTVKTFAAALVAASFAMTAVSYAQPGYIGSGSAYSGGNVSVAGHGNSGSLAYSGGLSSSYTGPNGVQVSTTGSAGGISFGHAGFNANSNNSASASGFYFPPLSH